MIFRRRPKYFLSSWFYVHPRTGWHVTSIYSKCVKGYFDPTSVEADLKHIQNPVIISVTEIDQRAYDNLIKTKEKRK